MPTIKSAFKRMKVSEKKRQQNKTVKNRYRTAIKRFEEQLANPDENLEELFKDTIRQIDKAASRGVLHKNKASRLKSQISRKKRDAVIDETADALSSF